MRVHIQHEGSIRVRGVRSHSHKNAISRPRGAHKHKFHAYITPNCLLADLTVRGYTQSLLWVFVVCLLEPVFATYTNMSLFFFALLCYDEAGILLFSTAFREKHVILCFRFPLDGVDYRQHVVGVVIR